MLACFFVFLFLFLATPTMPKIFGEIPLNEDSRFVFFFAWKYVWQNVGMFFVFLYFGIYENTCDVGNFEFTHFHSQLQMSIPLPI